MTKTKACLGSIQAHVAGMHHYAAAETLVAGTPLRLVREPANPHDENAIRVTVSGGRKVGYVPADLARWMAPLMDGKRVAFKPRLGEEPPHRYHYPLYLDVFLTGSGADILEPNPTPGGAADIVHETVRELFQRVFSLECIRVVREVAGLADGLDQEGLLPGTRLLLALIKGRADELERNIVLEMDGALGASFDALTVGEAMHYHSLTLFPLLGPNGHAPAYALLKDAIEARQARVEEVSACGSVPTIVVDNGGDLPLLIPEGEILVGAKQNRVVNVTILAGARFATEIPVSCVEQGRWHYRRSGFQATHCAPTRLRACKTASVLRNRRAMGEALSDQGEVWDCVESNLSKLGAESATASLTEGYASAEDRLKPYRRHFSLPPQTRGVVVARGGHVTGMDLFDCSDTLQSLWTRLSDGYFLDALQAPDPASQASREDAERFMARVRRGLRPALSQVGTGMQVEVSDGELVGAGVWHEGRLCHLAAFVTET